LIGVSSRIEDLTCSRLEVARRNIFAGPFHRDDVSERQQEASLCLDERGESLRARLCLTELAGQALRHEELGVWQTNPLGRDENREPDLQPEFNLRGDFRSDTDGLLEFLTVKPAGHALAELCPVGHLLAKLGQKPERPAHIPFRVSAPGVQTLTALVFDPDDPAIGDDALFDVRPGLTAEFHHLASDLEGPTHALDLTLILAPSAEGAEAAIPHAPPMRKEPHHVQCTG
jgi:hydroxyquinol 1,2-dioxygenase